MDVNTGEDLLNSIVYMLLTVLLLSFLLKRFKQPGFIAYMLGGILLGPHAFSLFTNANEIATIGSLGLIMQMFFIGTDLEIHGLVKNLRTVLIGTLTQLVLTLATVGLIGTHLHWSQTQIFVFGFIISMSSSAIVLEYLHHNDELQSRLGILTTGILIAQDILVVPMMIILNVLGHGEGDVQHLFISVPLAVLLVFLFVKTLTRNRIRISLPDLFKTDHELQIFLGLLICFGSAWLTSQANLSAAMGAMLAGVLIGQADGTQWLSKNLLPFRIFFLSLFFFSIGLQIDVQFLRQHIYQISLLSAAVVLINSGINALVFRLLKENWKNSLYAGALLSQIGEFSLVLCTVAKGLHLVDQHYFQLTLSVISLTMLLTFAWTSVIRNYLFKSSVITTEK